MEQQPGSGTPVGPRRLATRLGGAADPAFSVCIMLTDWDEFRECIASFRAGGFTEDRCEFLVVDNSQANQADAYVALNEFLQAARGRHVILCHQDILLIDHGIADLEARLAELDAIDPHWAVCGNAGHTDDGWPVLNLSQPFGDERPAGPLPMRVVSLDENFLVVRRLANLALSRDLHGYHHYGPDLCIVADILGWNSYVVDFFLLHKSAGTVDERYAASRGRIAAKYRRALRTRWMHVVTRQSFLLSGQPLQHRFSRLHGLIEKALGRSARHRHLDDPERRARGHAAAMRRMPPAPK